MKKKKMKKIKYFFPILFILLPFIGKSQDIQISSMDCRSLEVNLLNLNLLNGEINIEKEIGEGIWLKVHRASFSKEKKLYESLPEGKYRVCFIVGISSNFSSRYYSNELYLECNLNRNSNQRTMGHESISSNLIKNAYTLFPNPVHDVLNIRMNNFFEGGDDYMYVIYTLNGREEMLGKLEVDMSHLDLSTLTSGVYFMKIWNSNGYSDSFKIIKL